MKLLPDSIIPPHALKGHQAILKCNYDLEGDSLYSVKWYFNQKEFYRYIPTDNPKVTIFNHHEGVRVNVSYSKHLNATLIYCNSDTFTLKHTLSSTKGCEDFKRS